MGRWIRKILCCYIVLIFISIPLMGFAVGDGGVFGKSFSVFYLTENDQFAAIDYGNGIMKVLAGELLVLLRNGLAMMLF